MSNFEDTNYPNDYSEYTESAIWMNYYMKTLNEKLLERTDNCLRVTPYVGATTFADLGSSG